MDIDPSNPDIVELVDRYNKWRQIYGCAGKPGPDQPDWENGRLYFRYGYPYPDWSALILEYIAGGRYGVLKVSTERRETPIESSEGAFARIQDAGKLIVYKAATYLMIECHMEPISRKWRSAGLDPQVDAHVQNDRVVEYVLKNNPEASFIMTLGDMPYSHILPLSYDELDAVLLEAFPESVLRDLALESNWRGRRRGDSSRPSAAWRS